MDASNLKGQAFPTIIKVDPNIPAEQQEGIHNRWHPDVPTYATVKPGSIFKVETHEWTGGQIKNDDCADDIRNVDLTKIHYLSGPIGIEGAEPGDLLVVDILDVQASEQAPWGFTGIFEKDNGGGLFATDFDTHACKAIWDLQGVYATSRHIPGVRFAGIPHPGLIGTAPSHELLATWNKRERALIDEHAEKDAKTGAKIRDCCPAVALPPEPKGAYVGTAPSVKLDDKTFKHIQDEGARTVPGREGHGGNLDIKNLSRGSRCYFPVFVPGAKLSLGDLHFSQGDGEMSFCGAIEMAGVVTLKVSLIKKGVQMYNMKMPFFLPSPVDPMYAEKIVFEGVGVDIHESGRQGNMDATLAFKTAARECINYLQLLGYTREQAYLLLSAMPVDSHIGAVVDSPNACVTMGLPVACFDRDILPKPEGLEKKDYGQCAIRSDKVV